MQVAALNRPRIWICLSHCIKTFLWGENQAEIFRLFHLYFFVRGVLILPLPFVSALYIYLVRSHSCSASFNKPEEMRSSALGASQQHRSRLRQPAPLIEGAR
jgi:hypothetical protein